MGFYPAVPGRRMAWDDDGTMVFDARGTSRTVPGSPPWSELNATEQNTINDDGESYVNAAGNTFQIAFLFPELRDLDGIFSRLITQNSTPSTTAWQYSADTTNVIDGTWNAYTTITNSLGVITYYRESAYLTAASQAGVRGLYAATGGGGAWGREYAVHIYGEIAAGETPDRLLFIDETTSLEYTLPHDYAEQPRGMAAADEELRVRNNSATLQANDIDLNIEDLTGGSSTWYTLDIGGGGFGTTINIASLAAVTNSALITLRQVVDVSTVLSLHTARLKTVQASWT